MINENNLKINTNLNGGSEIDVSKISIDNFDILKNNLYLFRNPFYERALEDKNKNSEDWQTAPEDIKEILLKEYISSEEYNKVYPAQDRKRLYEVIEEKKYATLKEEELENFNEEIGLIDREDDEDFEEDREEAEKDDGEGNNQGDEEDDEEGNDQGDKEDDEEDDEEDDDNAQARAALGDTKDLSERNTTTLSSLMSSDVGQDSLDRLLQQQQQQQQQQRLITMTGQPRRNNNLPPFGGQSASGWSGDGEMTSFNGGGIPTSKVITRLFGDDTSPPNIVTILEDFNWGDDHIMVNDIKVRIPESYDEWFAKQTENMRKFVDDNKLSLDLIRFSNLLRENYQFYNPNFQLEKPVPDSETGVKYNGLVEKVDIEALQQLVKESHVRFKLHIQEFFGTLGMNPGIQVEMSQLGGFIKNLSVTEEQLNGGMIPMLLPFSLVSKVPSFMDDIEERLKNIIKRLENNGKKLVGDSKKNIFNAVDRVKKQEKQLKVLANSLEKIAKDPSSKNVVTLDEILKYSNKLEKGQIRGLDVAKTLIELEVN